MQKDTKYRYDGLRRGYLSWALSYEKKPTIKSHQIRKREILGKEKTCQDTKLWQHIWVTLNSSAYPEDRYKSKVIRSEVQTGKEA